MSVSPSELPPPALHPTGPPATADGASRDHRVEHVSPGVRAQILATEHWSLLATRSMTWSEVMIRITIHLTVASASLVVLALFAQASGFGTEFRVMAIGLATAVLILGSLTAARVNNASNDDIGFVIGMNRLRAAYLSIDPSLEPYLVTSAHDDQQGLMDTYLMLRRRSIFNHVVASTSIFVLVFNSLVAGTLGALVASAAGAGTAAVSLIGVGVGALHLLAYLEWGRRNYAEIRHDVRFPTPSDG